MQRTIRWGSLILCVTVLAFFASRATRAADDSATSQPSSSGSIVVTVLDSGGQPVAKARVQLYARKKASEDGDASAKPKALGRGATDDDGKYTFENVAAGDYRVNAAVRKAGTKGSAQVSVTDDAPNATVTINLSGGTATTAPAQ